MSSANSRALPGPQLLDFTRLVVCATAGFQAYQARRHRVGVFARSSIP
jgi:hypothetical protein